MWITFLINCYKKIMNAVLVLLWIIVPVVGGVRGGLVGVLCGLAAVLVFEFLVMPPVFVLFEINENQKEMKKANSSEPAPGGEVYSVESGRGSGWNCAYCDAVQCDNCYLAGRMF